MSVLVSIHSVEQKSRLLTSFLLVLVCRVDFFLSSYGQLLFLMPPVTCRDLRWESFTLIHVHSLLLFTLYWVTC